MPAVTSAEIKTALAPVLKQDEASLASYWGAICDHAAEFAYWEARDALLARGFRQQDVDGWDRLRAVTRDLGLWKALNEGGAYDAVPKETLDSFDRREDLKTVLVHVNGLWVQPAGNYPGLAASAGATVAQNSGVFHFSDDPGDVDHGMQV